MTDPLTILGGVASVVQLFGALARTTEVVTKFCSDVQDAPVEIRRIRDKLVILKDLISQFQQHLEDVDDDLMLPPDLRELLMHAVVLIERNTKALQDAFKPMRNVDPTSVPRRLKWALLDQHVMAKLLRHLQQSESTLNSVVQLLDLWVTLWLSLFGWVSLNVTELTESFRRQNKMLWLAVQQSCNGMNDIRQSLRCLELRLSQIDELSVEDLSGASRSQDVNFIQNRKPADRRKQITIGIDSLLRRIGLYGSLTILKIKDHESHIKFSVGYQFPQWLCKRSIDLKLHIRSLSTVQLGVEILPGTLRVQNRVHRDSAFMVACSQGDVTLIRQYLRDEPWHVSDSTACTGTTPLMLAIGAEKLDAIECLLQAGADPNMGDDDQVLPIFTLLGMRPRRSKIFPQLPSSWLSCMAAFRLLVKYGASVHEVVWGRSLTSLNFCGKRKGGVFQGPDLIGFFAILHSECYADFNAPDEGGWSALANAISGSPNTDAIRFLSKVGVDFTRIASNGRSSLHWAAEMAEDPAILEFICLATGKKLINRQDPWGWTPLHYAVLSAYPGYHSGSFEKIRMLLSHGADPEIKAGSQPLFFTERLQKDLFTAYELSEALRENVRNGYAEELRKAGKTFGADTDGEDDMFFDAMENLAES